jgi:hypothetical protein
MTFWVYKLTYDTGAAPHVRDGLLSLAICKPKIRLGAVPGDVIFGFGGRSRRAIRGERLIYAAQVTSKLAAPGEYYEQPQYRGRWHCISCGGAAAYFTRTAPRRTATSARPRCIRAPWCSSAMSSGISVRKGPSSTLAVGRIWERSSTSWASGTGR